MQLWNDLGVPKSTKRGAQKKEVKGFIWVIYKVFGNTLVLTVLRVEIHIRGLSVWSMSRRITTAGEVSWQTGPGHWMVLKTSLHSYINRIKMSNWGLLASFEHSRGRRKKTSMRLERPLQKASVLRMVGELKDDSVSHNLELESSNPSISTKRRCTTVI